MISIQRYLLVYKAIKVLYILWDINISLESPEVLSTAFVLHGKTNNTYKQGLYNARNICRPSSILLDILLSLFNCKFTLQCK